MYKNDVLLTLLIVINNFLLFKSENVTLSACRLSDLKNEKKFITVLELYAIHCNIPVLENAVFLRCSNLTVLEISDSKVSELQDFALNGLKSLKVLNLARNNITEVKSWSYTDLTSLVSLDLRRNAIKQITVQSFKRFPNLQKLNLAVNLIENIPYGVLRSLPHLKYINIGKNLLKRIDFYTFRGLHKLSMLALHCNEIDQINPQAFDTNNHLRSLRLESNGLADLEFMAQMNLARLVHLDLSNNAIDSLERLAFSKDYELKSLDVSYNLIEEIYVDTLSGLESLEMFNASHNRIHTIAAKSFAELTSLTYLDMSANNLTYLPVDIFNTTHHLRYVNMSGNALECLDTNHFHEVDQLQQLDLSINHLHQDNFIEGLLVHHSPSSLQLDLSNNMYSVLNLSLLYEFARVDLSGNLWDCKWLIQEMIRCPVSIHFGRNYTTKDRGHILSVPGVDCYDGQVGRSIIVLTGLWNSAAKEEIPKAPTSMIFWSRMRLNRFDDKEIVIWVLVSVIVGFALVRTTQIALARWALRAKPQKLQTTNEKQFEKLEMMPCDETESVASTLEDIKKAGEKV